MGSHRIPRAVLALVALCAAGAVSAESDLFKGSQAVKPGDATPTMDLATLRGCVQLERDIEGLRSTNHSAEMSLDVAETRLRAMQQWVQVMKQGLDLHDARAVDDFNDKVAEQASLTDAFNALVGPFNESLEALNASVERFNAGCTRPYREQDMLRVRVEREAALRKSSEDRRATDPG